MAKRKKPKSAPPAKPLATSPASLSIGQAAELLTRAGGRKITAAAVKAHVDAGAPTNADRTIHLVHYAAWLAARVE